MTKCIAKQWLRAFTLMAMMLTTSMVASAADRYYLRGGVTDDSPGWSSNNYQLRPYQGSTDKFYIDFSAVSGFQFKLFLVPDGAEEGVWIGSNNGGYDHVAINIPYTFTSVKPNEGDNMIIGGDGTYRFIYDIANQELQINYAPCPVILYDMGNFEGGTIKADKTEAAQGDIVTLTVNPGYGYICDKDNITIEWIINGGEAQAPKHAPQVGETFHPDGDLVATHDLPANYTFTMPEYPYGVWINAEFQDIRHKITLRNDLAHCTIATDQPDNDGVPAGTLVTVTPTATPAEDFVATGLNIFIDGEGILDHADIGVTANSDGTFSFVMPEYDIIVAPIYKAYLHGVVLDPGRNHWATYYGAYNLEVPEGVTAYVVTGVENDEVTVEEYDIIPMNTGVLLYAEHLEEPMFNITTEYIGEIDPGATSLLWGSADEYTSGGYVLYEDKFILSMRGIVSAHRCSLPWQTVNGSGAAGAPHVLKIKLPGEGGVITGVDNINAADVVSVKYVNMNGMTSDKPFQGVNIVVETLSDGTTRTVKVVK